VIDVLQIDKESCRDLVPAVCDILDQVTGRRLPSLFDYHSVPSPWFTISLLRLLSLLAAADRKYAAVSCCRVKFV